MRLDELMNSGGGRLYDALPSIESREIAYPLYHISFDGSLAGIWKPRNPDGISGGESLYPEPQLPRISTSPTLTRCFQAIYPNISKLFEMDNHPSIDFYVYRPMFQGSERVLPPGVLTSRLMVHDAHLTSEHCILDNVMMELVDKVRIMNTNDRPFVYYHPFDKPNNKEQGFAPRDIEIINL